MPSTFEGLCSILNRKTGGIDTEAGLLKLKETMEICSTMPARCLCLNILKASKGSKELLERFLSEGGWRLLNGWLNDSKSAKNADLVLEILRIFKGLPLRTKILRTTSTPKLIRILTRDSLSTGPCETETTEEVMSLAKILKKEWTESIIKEKQKVNANKADSAGAAIKNSHKSKSQQQQQSTSSNNEVKKRLTTTDGVERKATNKRPGAAERDVPEKKVKKREPAKQQTRVAESHNFMDALMESTAPIPRKTKKAKAKTPTPTPTTIILPSLPLSTTVEKSEGKNSPDYLTLPPRSPKLDKNGNPKKTVRWPENDMLCMVRYFEVDKDERANVNSQSFKDKMMQDHKFERSNSIHDWKCPPELTGLPEPIVERGCKSTEKEDQRERESRVLQSLFLDKNLVPHSPAEPEYEDVEFVVTPIIPFGDSLESIPLTMFPDLQRTDEGHGMGDDGEFIEQMDLGEDEESYQQYQENPRDLQMMADDHPHNVPNMPMRHLNNGYPYPPQIPNRFRLGMNRYGPVPNYPMRFHRPPIMPYGPGMPRGRFRRGGFRGGPRNLPHNRRLPFPPYH